MRYRVLWETDTDETVVSVDIHDDSEMQQRQIERLEVWPILTHLLSRSKPAP